MTILWEHTTPDGRTYDVYVVYALAQRKGWIPTFDTFNVFVLLDVGLIDLVETTAGPDLMLSEGLSYAEALQAIRTINILEGKGFLNE